MPKTLKEAQNEIFYFIGEAEKCLEHDCGYSAMSTIYSVILAVSEALLGKASGRGRRNEKELINNFYDYMIYKDWFLQNKTKKPSEKIIKNYLYHVRNDIAHQISLPRNIGLITQKTDIRTFRDKKVLYFISVKELIVDVRKTVEKLLIEEECSSRIMDPNFGTFSISGNRESRETGGHMEVTDSNGTVTSGSFVSSKTNQN